MSNLSPIRRLMHRYSVSIRLTAALIALFFVLLPRAGVAYSVQTHEQIIDLTWKSSIEPLLRRYYPGLTDAQLLEAHAYAYGGSAIQDLGYYPFGNPFFSDLTHYVRSGDFISNLIHNARSADELAFAIGAMAHFIGDTIGHADAVNPAVALTFPSLGKKYGPVVTYADSEHAHVRTEFAFDINEISKRRFAPSAYLKHIGLAVAQPLLARAFFETYGLSLYRVVGHKPVVRGYSFAVRSFLPRIAYAETLLHRSSFPPDSDSPAFKQLQAELAQSDFENGWDAYRKEAGFGTHLLAGLIFILPKIGPLSYLSIRGPSPETEALYVASVNRSTIVLRRTLANFDPQNEFFPNRDLDTGSVIRPGGYVLTDYTYARLLRELTRNPLTVIPEKLKHDVLAYYSDPNAPISTRKNAAKWALVQSQLQTLTAMTSRPERVLLNPINYSDETGD